MLLVLEVCTKYKFYNTDHICNTIMEYIFGNTSQIINSGTGAAERIEKTGTCNYQLNEVTYDGVNSTLNGTDATTLYTEGRELRLRGQARSAIVARSRLAGMLHYETDTLRYSVDDGSSVRQLAYLSDVQNSIRKQLSK